MLEVENLSPLTGDMFSRDYHDGIISRYRIQLQSGEDVIEDLCLARKRKLQYFVATSTEIGQWIDDIQSISDENLRKRLLFESYRLIVKDYSVVQYWEPFLLLIFEIKEELVKNSKQEVNLSLQTFLEKDLDVLIQEGIAKTAHDFKDRHHIFQLQLKIILTLPLSTQYDVRLQNLKIPHAKIDDSFQEVSSFVSQNFPDEYEKRMINASKLFSNTKRKLRYYETHELAIAENPRDPQLWVNYLEDLGKYSSVEELSQLFERAIAAVSSLTIQVWQLIWISYIYMIYENREVFDSKLPDVLTKFVRTYPDSSTSYAEYVRNCELIEDFLAIRSRYAENDVMHKDNYDQWKVLALAIVSFYYNNISEIANKEMILNDLEAVVRYAIETNIDAYNVVEKITIPFIEEIQPQLASQLYRLFIEKNLSKADTWLFMDKRERLGGSYASKYLEMGLENAMALDSPELVVLEWLSNQILSNSVNYCSAIARVDKVMKQVSLKRINERTNSISQDNLEPTIEQTPTRIPVAEPTRNREEFSAKVRNLPPQINEEQLAQFFEDCGTVVEVHIIKNNAESAEATVEFSNEKALFAAITKDRKHFEDYQIEVKKAERTTVWVTNYPPYMTQEEIRDIFSEIGPVVSIRFPSLKFNQNRRFCYIEFTGSESATEAVKRLNGYKIDDFKLVVKISRPEERTARNVGPVDQGREIFVQNLSFDKVSSEILEQHFLKYGKIEKVSLPRGKGNNLNSGYGFVTFHTKSSAEDALSENGKELEGRKVNVSISRSRGQLEPPLKTPTDSSTSAVVKFIDVDDTVTPEVIKRFASTVGPVKSVNILKDHVAVEYENASDSGKAVLQLNGSILGKGKILVTGVSQTKSRLFVPPHLVRKRTAASSGSGTKRSKIQ